MTRGNRQKRRQGTLGFALVIEGDATGVSRSPAVMVVVHVPRASVTRSAATSRDRFASGIKPARVKRR